MIKEIRVNGETIKVGDVVGFKSDIEQSGEVSRIERSQWGGGYTLYLKSEHGFLGEYIGGLHSTTISSREIF